MKNIKDAINALKTMSEDNDISLIGIGTQRSEDWVQETAVDMEHYLNLTDNYIIEMKGNRYLFNIERDRLENRYTAQEDEWIDDTTLERDLVKYSIAPLYFQEKLDSYYDPVSKLGNSYTENKLTDESDVPDFILKLADQVIENKKNLQKINQNLKFDSEEEFIAYQQECYEESQYMMDEPEREPHEFDPVYKEPLVIPNKTIFDIQLGLKDSFRKARENSDYLFDRLLEAQEDAFIKPDVDYDGNIEDLKELNKIANATGKPEAFFKKLNKYSNTEGIEMFHMMKESNTVVEIFSKDLDKYEEKPTEEIKNKKNRSNRPK